MTILSPFTPAPVKFSNPFLVDLAVPLKDAERGRFLQRFDWLDVLPQPKTAKLANWDAYEAEVDEVRSTTVR
jgi:hypothetical protein